MANLYNDAVAINTRKSKTSEDRSGPELTWLVVENTNNDFEGGASYTPELTTRNSTNFQVVQAIQQWCEVYEVVRPGSGLMSIQVRTSSVPYDSDDAPNDTGINTILTDTVRAAMGGNTGYNVWNGAFRDDNLRWD